MHTYKYTRVRCLRKDRFTHAIFLYARSVLGAPFLEPVTFNLDSAYRISDPRTPIVIIMPDGIDVRTLVQGCADKKHIKLRSVALGQV
jgi:hypothetical protein